MTNEITIAPVSIMVAGANKAERQMSVVRQASGVALTACLDIKGKVGKEIRTGAATTALVDVAKAAASGNYKPLAEMLAIRTGEPVLISSRSTFEALPDMFKARVYQAALGKDGGYRTDKKTGTLVPGAKLKSAEELHALVSKVVEAVAQYHAQRKTDEQPQGLRRVG